MFWGAPFSPLQTDIQESGQLFTAQINELDQTKHSQGNKIQMQKHDPRHPGNPSLLSVIAPHSKGPTTQPLNGLVSNLASTKPGVSASFAHHSV